MRVLGSAPGEPSATGAARPVCPLCGQDRLKHLYERQYQSRTWRLARCLDCGLHFTDPQPTRDDINAFYAGDYHSELRADGAAEKISGQKYERYTRMIRRFAPSGRTLDVGCATGLFPHMLRNLGYEAEGLELNRESREFGSARYGLPIHGGTLEDIAALNPARYDLITMTDVLEDTQHPPSSLQLVNRLLKKSAHAMITFPDILSVESRYYRLLSRLTGRDWVWRTCRIPHHTWEFTKASAVECFEQAGFKVVAFRRSADLDRFRGGLALLSLPVRPLALPPIAAYIGSQMEFLLQRVGEPKGAMHR